MLLAILVFVLGAGAVARRVRSPGGLHARRGWPAAGSIGGSRRVGARPTTSRRAEDESVVKRLIEGPLPALDRLVSRTSRRIVARAG